MGLKESGLRGSLRNVSVGIDAIPDSAQHRYFASEVPEGDGETVESWDDLIGSVDLQSVGNPTISSNAVNDVDAINLDGEDAYDYIDNLDETITEPFTIIFSLSIESLDGEIYNLWHDNDGDDSTRNRILLRDDTGDLTLDIDGENTTVGDMPDEGDHIITVAVDDSEAVLRVDGMEESTAPSSQEQPILRDDGVGGFYYDAENNDRFLESLAVEISTYNERLSGEDLDEEEERHEDNANMNVL